MLGELTGQNFNSIPTTCKRLRNSGFFDLSGPGGGSQAVRHFDFSDEVIKAFAKEILASKSTTSLVLPDTTRHSNSAQPDTWADTNASSMYVSNKYNTIHTTPGDTPTEIEENPWSELYDIDFTELEKLGIRKPIIETLKKNKWVIDRLQFEELTERFVRYFTEKEFEKRREPIKNTYSFFLGAIKAIAKGEPDPICDVKTHLEIARQLAVQNKLKEMEMRRRENEARSKQLDQCRDSEFENWLTELNEEQKISIAAPNGVAKLGTFGHKQLLKSYFVENIWPEFKQSILNGIELQN
jgi:hypothetical protein